MAFKIISTIFAGLILNAICHGPFLNVNHDCTVFVGNRSFQQQETSKWSSLISIALEVVQKQNKLSDKRVNLSRSFLLMILNDHSLWKSALTFINTISSLHPVAQIIHFNIGTETIFKNMSETFTNLMVSEIYINTVVVISDNITQITHLLEIISGKRDLAWTSIVHITEWIIVCPQAKLQPIIQTRDFMFDYVTLVYSQNESVNIVAQKCRRNNFKNVAQIFSQSHTQTNREAKLQSNFSLDVLRINYIICPNKIRLHPLLHLRALKSEMANLQIPAALPVNAYSRTVSEKKDGNNTIFDGFSVAVMKLIADALGFKLKFDYVTDGGDYGEVLHNKSVTGITGKLARREAAMAALVSRLANRETVIDFLPIVLVEESANIVYRLPETRETLDTTYITIFKSEFLLSLVGPLILTAITAGIVYFLTQSCTVARPYIPATLDARKLIDCTENMCFHHRREYVGQTSRILRASWAVFSLILVSAYSAYLATTFAVKPEELKIRTFEELLAHGEFSFGMHGSSKALPIILKTSLNTKLHEIWHKLIAFNKTNPQTFSLELGDHVKRIKNGRYAFLDNFSIGSGELYDYISPDETDIRAYPQNSLKGLTTSYIALPKYVFFKDTLYKSQLDLEASGIVQRLQTFYFSRKNKINVSKAKTDTTAVDLQRIQLVLYAAVAGIGISSACLGAEFALKWCRHL